jgi:hypothetical protein
MVFLQFLVRVMWWKKLGIKFNNENDFLERSIDKAGICVLCPSISSSHEKCLLCSPAHSQCWSDGNPLLKKTISPFFKRTFPAPVTLCELYLCYFLQNGCATDCMFPSWEFET